MKKKPKWGRPKLIVLVRGKPEERVLTACKSDLGQAESQLEASGSNCWEEGLPTCVACDAWDVS